MKSGRQMVQNLGVLEDFAFFSDAIRATGRL